MSNPVLVLLDEKDGKKNILSLLDKKEKKILLINLVRDYEVDEEAEVHGPVFSIRIAPISQDGNIGEGLEVKLSLEDVFLLITTLQEELMSLVRSFISLRDFICTPSSQSEEKEEEERKAPFFRRRPFRSKTQENKASSGNLFTLRFSRTTNALQPRRKRKMNLKTHQ